MWFVEPVLLALVLILVATGAGLVWIGFIRATDKDADNE